MNLPVSTAAPAQIRSKGSFVQNMIRWATSRLRGVRTIVPGKVSAFEDGTRERNVDFTPGIADLQAGEPSPVSLTPDAPLLSMVGGGFAVLLPSAAEDEALGLVSDRAIGPWRQTREVGQADPINGKRSHNMSDVLVMPFGITVPSSAPATWDHYMVVGPEGKAIEVEVGGPITLTKQGVAVATISMVDAGGINIVPAVGQKVKIGNAPTKPTMNSDLLQALDAFANAVPVAMDGGAAIHTAFKTAYLAVRATLETTEVEVK